MLTSCALLVPYVSSQKGEFIMDSHTRVSPCGIEGSTLPVTLLHILSLTMTIISKRGSLVYVATLVVLYTASRTAA